MKSLLILFIFLFFHQFHTKIKQINNDFVLIKFLYNNEYPFILVI